MPTNKNAINRYKVLDKLLSDRHHYYDIKDLTSLCNRQLEIAGYPTVSSRCIEKDIEFFQGEPFLAPIKNIRKNGKSCYLYKHPGYSIFNKVVKPMSDDEYALLAEVLKTIGQFDGLPNFEWLDHLKAGLNLDDSRKIISFSNNPYLKNTNLLAGLYSAISNKQVIELNYHPGFSNEVHKVVLHPYLLKQYNSNWFLFGAVDSDYFIMNQPLDRIDSFTPLPEMTYRECPEDLEERFDDIVGVTLPKDAETEDILIWTSDTAAKRLDAKPIHGSHTPLNSEVVAKLHKKYTQFKGEGRFFKYECIDNFELRREFISFFDELVVLEPEHLRKEIDDAISTLNEKYSMLRTKCSE